MAEVDGLNAGYARAVLEEYLENPEAVPAEWRELFEGDSTLLRAAPGRRTPARAARGGRQRRAGRSCPAPLRPPRPRRSRSRRSTRRCSAPSRRPWRWSRPTGRTATSPPASTRSGPSLSATRHWNQSGSFPPLTPELQAQIPARLLRVHVPGETLADVLPKLQETYCGTSAYEIEHISDHQERVWLRQAIEAGHVPRAARRRRQAPAPRAALGGRRARALPSQGVPRPEAVLDRGARRDGPDARPRARAGRQRTERTRS